tara:strand:+ start:312 stop:749 length:438 start_codon:yes stop_codon:yes gene_type:complete
MARVFDKNLIDLVINNEIPNKKGRVKKMEVIFTRKPCDIKEAISTISKYGGNSFKVKVMKTIELNNSEFKKFTDNFYNNDSRLEKIGGGDENGYAKVVKIENIGDDHLYQSYPFTEIYINTEGFDYARYVGFDVRDLDLNRRINK